MKLLLHAKVEAELKAILNRPAGSYIFHGLDGTGTCASAVRIAQRLNCQAHGHTKACSNCALIAAGNYPDLIVIEKGEKDRIGIGQIQELQSSLSLTPYYQKGQRVVIIREAERLTLEAQNCLLKTIEEPPARTIVILTATTIDSLIETIRSRCAAVFFPRLANQQVIDYLVEGQIKPDLAKQAAHLSDGRVGLAIKLTSQTEIMKSRLELEAQINSLLEPDHFQRLTRAGRLVDQIDLKVLADSLAQRFRREARQYSDVKTWRRLTAVQRFRDHLAANVTPRAALESLVLKL